MNLPQYFKLTQSQIDAKNNLEAQIIRRLIIFFLIGFVLGFGLAVFLISNDINQAFNL